MNSGKYNVLAVFGLAGILFGLSGCGSADQEELQEWMTQQRNATKPRVDPLPEPTKFSPQPYGQEGSIEPFSNQ
ncbi:MAG: pilus assembly protein PilP, partial [Polaromonas sp.]